jgi:hypothetical protein
VSQNAAVVLYDRTHNEATTMTGTIRRLVRDKRFGSIHLTSPVEHFFEHPGAYPLLLALFLVARFFFSPFAGFGNTDPEVFPLVGDSDPEGPILIRCYSHCSAACSQ